MAFAGVVDGKVCYAERLEQVLDGGNDGAGRRDVVALLGEVAAIFADCGMSVVVQRLGQWQREDQSWV